MSTAVAARSLLRDRCRSWKAVCSATAVAAPVEWSTFSSREQLLASPRLPGSIPPPCLLRDLLLSRESGRAEAESRAGVGDTVVSGDPPGPAAAVAEDRTSSTSGWRTSCISFSPASESLAATECSSLSPPRMLLSGLLSPYPTLKSFHFSMPSITVKDAMVGQTLTRTLTAGPHEHIFSRDNTSLHTSATSCCLIVFMLRFTNSSPQYFPEYGGRICLINLVRASRNGRQE
mmetsp:Transcript_13633/g.33015  ORF Transcript_13633/g.33015 Transcript_13633/m.33015 type:complete len:232 (-) Transcript_13633:469-1164(-)